jgi:hypothetical protein
MQRRVANTGTPDQKARRRSAPSRSNVFRQSAKEKPQGPTDAADCVGAKMLRSIKGEGGDERL